MKIEENDGHFDRLASPPSVFFADQFFVYVFADALQQRQPQLVRPVLLLSGR